MIDSALTYLGERLNRFFQDRNGDQEEHVILGPVIDRDGSIPSSNEHRVVVSLVMVEPVADAQAFSRRSEGDPTRLTVPQSMNLDLHVVIAASAGDYRTGLRDLSLAIGFLHLRPFFDPRSPGFPRGIDKLALEMVTMDFAHCSRLWSGLNARHLPSALYRMRLIGVDLSEIDHEISQLSALDSASTESPAVLEARREMHEGSE